MFLICSQLAAPAPSPLRCPIAGATRDGLVAGRGPFRQKRANKNQGGVDEFPGGACPPVASPPHRP